MIFRRGEKKSFKTKKREALEETETLKKLREEASFEKGDYLALIIAALTTIIPIAAIILFLYYIIMQAIF